MNELKHYEDQALRLSEKELKPTIEDYLDTMQMMGKLMYLRLNSGNFFLPCGNGKFRMVKGCPKGCSDYEVLIQGRHIFVELKGYGGKQSDEQKAFEEAVVRQGGTYAVVHSLDELLEILGL